MVKRPARRANTRLRRRIPASFRGRPRCSELPFLSWTTVPWFLCPLLFSDRRRNRERYVRHFVAIVQVGLLAWSAYWHSPVGDEVGHLPAAIAHWHTGAFDLYRVNPPLSRLVAGVPAVAAGAELDWSKYRSGPSARPEWNMGD